MKNKYSLTSESYGITKLLWNTIKKEVVQFNINSVDAISKYKLDEVVKDKKIVKDDDMCKKRVWFLYDTLLQEKYNHLYKREKLVNPKASDYVYCDYEDFGRGTIVELFSDDLMFVKFYKRPLNTMCSSKLMVTVHDDIKRKITKL